LKIKLLSNPAITRDLALTHASGGTTLKYPIRRVACQADRDQN
jgi:hypothetical protein